MTHLTSISLSNVWGVADVPQRISLKPFTVLTGQTDAGLDPLLLLKVLGYLKEANLQGTQVILTTQSPWLLDAVDLESVVVSKSSEEQTVFSPLQDEVYQSDPRVLPGGRYLEFLRMTNP